jgi:hypothetical protein
MALEDDHPFPEQIGSECREPSLEDLVKLCSDLNVAGAKYVIVGGFAIIQAGYARRTMDIDILMETTTENERRVVEALMKLPDQAIKDMLPGEVDKIGVVRVADDFMVDLMKSGCGVFYADAIQDAVWREVSGVRIPFASKRTLWKMKQTVREKDVPDKLFLRQALEDEGIPLDPLPPSTSDPLAHAPRWIVRLAEFFFGSKPK